MEVLYPRCAGLDVHKETVVACVRLATAGPAETHVQTFATTTKGLLALADWLTASACTHVAMESTGVYWKPVWHVLAADFELVLVNAAHLRHVPGRKSDVADAVWLADLLAHGLVRGSFVPPPPCRPCATSPVRASSWCEKRAGTCNASTRCSKTRTSS